MTADYFPLPHSVPILDRDHSLNENSGFYFTPHRLPFYCTILRLHSEDRSINILGDFCLIFVSTVGILTAEEESFLASRSGIWTQTCQLPKSYSVLGLDLLKAYKILWDFLCKIHMSICKLLPLPPLQRFNIAKPTCTRLANRPGPDKFIISEI